jgi:hypothetical protein
MTGNIPVLCEACEAGYIAGPICPECGTETCAQCGWCDECTSQTVHWPAGPYAGPDVREPRAV